MYFHLAVGLLALATSAEAAEPEGTEPAPSAVQNTAPGAQNFFSGPPPQGPIIELERLPPRHSWDLGVALSYGSVDHWSEFFDAWVGFGLRGAWGKHRGPTRFGVDAHLTVEGPVGVHTSVGLEPHMSIDHITSGGLLLGAGLGPGLFYHAEVGESFAVKGERTFALQPSLVGRIGWSQGWTRVGRRVFVYAEPKLRPTFREASDGIRRFAPNPVIALVVGSGRGR